MTDDDIVAQVLRYEGGYTNHPDDHGGPTNFGITALDLGAWRQLGRKATPSEVAAMTRDEAVQIYRKRYIADPRFDQIPDMNLRMIVVDGGVLFGVAWAAKRLQQALGVTPIDGRVGPATIQALTAAGVVPRDVAKSVLGLRFKAIGAILGDDKSKTQVVFAAGWINRAVDLLKYV
jgi:lysozyme family protein